jgi:hypothetical protein
MPRVEIKEQGDATICQCTQQGVDHPGFELETVRDRTKTSGTRTCLEELGNLHVFGRYLASCSRKDNPTGGQSRLSGQFLHESGIPPHRVVPLGHGMGDQRPLKSELVHRHQEV